MLGVVKEEFDELSGAVRDGSLTDVEDELGDEAVACIVSLASIETGEVQW